MAIPAGAFTLKDSLTLLGLLRTNDVSVENEQGDQSNHGCHENPVGAIQDGNNAVSDGRSPAYCRAADVSDGASERPKL